MISPISSSGSGSPPPPSTFAKKNEKKRMREEKEERKEHKEPVATSSSSSLDRILAGSVSAVSSGLPQFLRKKINFREATHSESLKGIVSKNSNTSTSAYVSYAAKKPDTLLSSSTTSLLSSNNSNNSNKSDYQRDAKYGFKSAEVDLFSKDRLQPFLKWSRVRSIGPGLINMGNTCFLNSVLQCLFYTCPLAEYLLAREHSKRCKTPREEFCGLCVLERLIQKVHQPQQRNGESVIRPIELVSRIKAVGKHFRPGRQEDSHEFLRLFIDTLQRASLGGSGVDIKALDARSKETTMIHRVFGGYLQSTVTCSSCKHVSRTFDQFLDLSLDVNKSENISSAFKVFTTPELLSKGNRYKCESCHRLVDAHKQFSIYKTPEILTIQLKRFSVNPFTGQMNKLNRPVNFPESLNISEWISDKGSNESGQYRLYGVIVHEGHSCNSGHYHAFVRNSNDIWYSMNDCSVHQVSLDTVLRQRAYILFYQKVSEIKKEKESETKIVFSAENANIVTNKVKKSTEEKMAALKEASRIYTENLKGKEQEIENVEIENSSDSAASSSDLEISENSSDSVPQLVSSSASSSSSLRSNSMWHMTPLTESFNMHPPATSKRIKYNFSTEWRVSKL